MTTLPSRYAYRSRRSSKKRDRRPLFFLLALVIVALDRLSKLWVQKHVYEGGGITIVPGVFRISHVLNEGAAFSLFNDAPANPTRWALTGFSVVAALIIIVLLIRTGRRFSWTAFGLALVLGGAIGNAWDRIQYKMVTDFLEVKIVHYHWPDFNLADSAIVVGGILLFLGALFTPQANKPEEVESDSSA